MTPATPIERAASRGGGDAEFEEALNGAEVEKGGAEGAAREAEAEADAATWRGWRLVFGGGIGFFGL